MNLTLTLLPRRALALAILITLIVLAWTLVAQPVVGLSIDRWADISTLSEQLAHLKAVAARRPELEERADLVKARLASSGGFWIGASTPAVAASIQNLVRQATTGSGGQLRSASEGTETPEHGFRRVTVRFGIEGTLETVQQTLEAVSRATPSLFVESVAFRSLPTGFDHNRPPMLDLDLSVVGYMEPSR